MPVDMTYDPEADAIYIRLAADVKPHEAEEVAPRRGPGLSPRTAA